MMGVAFVSNGIYSLWKKTKNFYSQEEAKFRPLLQGWDVYGNNWEEGQGSFPDTCTLPRLLLI